MEKQIRCSDGLVQEQPFSQVHDNGARTVSANIQEQIDEINTHSYQSTLFEHNVKAITNATSSPDLVFCFGLCDAILFVVPTASLNVAETSDHPVTIMHASARNLLPRSDFQT